MVRAKFHPRTGPIVTETDIGAAPPQVAFDGPRGPLFGLLVRNLLLTVVTLGIYRFWAKTRVRRFFWRHTKLLGEPLEYVGTGGELFVGFLIAIVILVPLSAIYSLLQFFTLGVPGVVPLAVDLAYYTIILFLIQIAIHRMRRYRLTRTAWRGVRFGLDGSSVRYALISFGWGIATVLSLGLASPWLRVATMRYFFNHARFGTAGLSLDASARWLFPRWLAVGAPFALSVALYAALNWSVFAEIVALNARAQEGAEVGRALSEAGARLVHWPLLFIVLGSILGVWYSVVEFRYLLGRVTLGPVTLHAGIGTPFVYRVYVVFWGAVLASFLALGGIMAAAGQFGGGTGGPLAPALAGFIVLAFFLFIVLLGILRTLFVDVTLLKRACATLTIGNPAALDDVLQASADLPGHGEGLADALDVGGF